MSLLAPGDSALRLADSAERVVADNGDGTYSEVRDMPLEIGTQAFDGLLTWRYEGQARYSWDPRPWEGERSFVYRTKEPRSLAEQLIGSGTVDALGGKWLVESVAENELVSPLPSTEEEGTESLPNDSGDPEPPEGTLISWTPTSWTHRDCIPGGDVESHEWQSETRYTEPNPTGRQKAAVFISSPLGWCAGVVLRDDWVITAAHCFFDSNDDLIDPVDVDVTLDWAGQTRGVSFVLGPNGFNAPTDTDDDFMLLELDSPFTATFDDMDLSVAGDSVLQGVGGNFHNLGYPAFFPTCNAQSTLVHSSDSDITAFPAQTLRWRGDGGEGHSGGPLYYCPEGDDSVCGPGETGFVVAVWSGWSNYYDRQIGARSSDFYDWAQTTMDNN